MCLFSLVCPVVLLLFFKSTHGFSYEIEYSNQVEQTLYKHAKENLQRKERALVKNSTSTSQSYRLPSSIHPQLYDLDILIVLNESPDLDPSGNQHEPWKTEGTLTISVLAKEPVTTIKMHKDPKLVMVKDDEIQVCRENRK